MLSNRKVKIIKHKGQQFSESLQPFHLCFALNCFSKCSQFIHLGTQSTKLLDHPLTTMCSDKEER